MVGALASSLAALLALAAPAGPEASPSARPPVSGDTRPVWAKPLHPGARSVLAGIAFEGPAGRGSWSGRGGEDPWLPNFTARARKTNRRVEVGVARAGPGT
jgi:hypothetical protein